MSSNRKVAFVNIIFFGFYLNINGIYSSEDCQQWQQMCVNANSAHNVNFRCINTTVYYFDYETQSWDKARQLCSQKFYGSYTADLVELSSKNIEDVNTTIKGILQEHFPSGQNMEIYANGVCCKRKKTYEYRRECQWLSDEEKIEAPFTNNQPEVETKCNILLLKAYMTNNELNYYSNYVEKTNENTLPYLCTYRAPEKCLPVNKTTAESTTSGTTTVQHVSVNSLKY